MMAFACGSTARPLLSEPSLDKGRVIAALRPLKAGSEAFREAACSDEIASWLARTEGGWRAHLYSDGGLDLQGEKLAAVFGGQLRIETIGTSGDSLGVTGLRLERDAAGGSVATFELWNGWPGEKTARIEISRGKQELASTLVAAAPGWSRASARLPGEIADGSYAIGLEPIAEGSTPASDIDAAPGSVYRLSVGAQRALSVLVVGTPDPFLKAALAFGGVSYTTAPEFPASLEGVNIVVSEPGSATRPPSSLNCNLLAFGDPPPDAPLAKRGLVSGRIVSTEPGHPLSRFVSWEGARADSARSYSTRPGAVVLADVGGSPALVAWERNGYRSLAFGIDLSRSDLGLKSAFPVLAQNFFQWCVPRVDDQSAFTLVVGEASRRALPRTFAVRSDRVDLLRTGPTAILTPREEGFFKWEAAGTKWSRSASGYLAANVPAEELDVAPRELRAGQAAGQSGNAAATALASTDETRRMPLGAWAVVLLVACLAAEWLVWKGSSKTMGALRAASIAAAALALAGASLPYPTRARTIVVLVDASNSIGSSGIEASREAALSLVRALAPRDRVAAVSFAGRTRVLTPPTAPARAAAILESAELGAPQPEATDLSAAIDTASALAASGPGSKTLYLFSDGRANGGAPPSGPALASRRVAIDVVPAGSASASVIAQGLAAPEQSHPGERAALTWRLFSATARKIGYALRVDGALASRGAAALSAGLNEISLAVDAGSRGRRAVTVEAILADGSSPEEARSGAYLEVGAEPEVLVVTGDSAAPGVDGARGASPIAAALRAQGMKAESGGPSALPSDSAGYAGLSAVVLDDLPALAITESQQASLQDYVAGGGGLLVVGGESSLGRGEYYATPLEDMLPVETDSRQRLLFTREKLLFIIDHSGSMSEMIGSGSKEQAAMRGVAASIDRLKPIDEVGIIGFDTSPSWVLPFTPASDREKILASLSGLGEGGGTDLSTALEEAIRGFGEPGPTNRHAIILTDGLTPDADFRGLSARLADAGVTVSTIGIGDEVNDTLLRDIAEWCGGKYYRATADQIPTVIGKETLRMTRDLIQEGAIRTRISAPSTIVEGLGATLPTVRGYLVTKAKTLATLELEAEGKAGRDSGGKPISAWDPLLASWRYGNGKVAVFTSDSGRHWLSAWSGESAYNRLWSQTIRAIERASPDSSLRASAIVEGGNAHLIVEAQGPDRRSLASQHILGSSPVFGAGGKGVMIGLTETAPGRYEGYLPLGGTGLVGLEAIDPQSGARASTWVWSPPSPESTGLGPDLASLSLIASSTGGKVLSQKTLAPPPAALHWRSLALVLPLLVLSVLLLGTELYLRSTMTGQVARALAAFAAWWSTQKTAAEASRMRGQVANSRDSDANEDARQAELRRKIAENLARRYRREQEKVGGGDE